MRAVAKGLRVPPRKMGVVASLVRNRTVDDALVILTHTPRRAATALHGVVKSAAANAENNDKVAPKELIITGINVGSGGMMKRYRPNARLSVRPYRHRLSNVTVTLGKQGENNGS